MAAHYADRFVAASPGAGFAETAQYQKLKPENYPPKYEQLLWGIYDVPGYTRNLFNMSVIAYSGELDKQIQAAQVMEEAFAAEGQKLPHLIGPGMDTSTIRKCSRPAAAFVGDPKVTSHRTGSVIATDQTSALQHACMAEDRWNAIAVFRHACRCKAQRRFMADRNQERLASRN